MGDFKSAFASARKSGKKVFTWNGKSYNTKLADVPAKKKFASTPAKGPVPGARAPIPTAAPRAKSPAKPQVGAKPAGKFSGVSSDDFPKTPAKRASAAPGPQNKRLQADREAFIKTEKKRYNDDLRFQRGK